MSSEERVNERDEGQDELEEKDDFAEFGDGSASDSESHFGWAFLLVLLIFGFTFYCQVKYGERPGVLALFPEKLDGHYIRLITHMFIHQDWNHFFSNMVPLAIVMVPLIAGAGPALFLASYFGAGVLSGLLCAVAWPGAPMMLGASGGVFGVLGTAALAVPFGTRLLREGEDDSLPKPWVLIGAIFFCAALPALHEAGIATFQTNVNEVAHWVGLGWGLLVPALLVSRAFLVSIPLFGVEMFLGEKLAPYLGVLLMALKKHQLIATVKHHGLGLVVRPLLWGAAFLAVAVVMWVVAVYVASPDDFDDDDDDDDEGSEEHSRTTRPSVRRTWYVAKHAEGSERIWGCRKCDHIDEPDGTGRIVVPACPKCGFTGEEATPEAGGTGVEPAKQDTPEPNDGEDASDKKVYY